MRLDAFTLSGGDRPDWERALGSIDRRDAYFEPGYAEACAIADGGRAVCLVGADGDRVALEVLLLRPVDGLPFLEGERTGARDAVTPYGYGGPLLSSAAADDPAFGRSFGESVANWCRGQGVVTRFVRFHPLLENAARAGDRIEVRSIQPTVFIDLARFDDPIEGFAPPARRAVRRAVEAKLAVRELPVGDHLGAFIALYEETMARARARSYYYFDRRYYEALAAGLGDRLRLFAVFAGADLAAAALYMVGSTFAHYHLGASSERHLATRPNNLLMLDAARRFRAEGFAALHLGGGLSGEDSLFRFKKSLGTGRATFSGGRQIVDEKSYVDLTARWERWSGPRADAGGYFPAYRAPVPETSTR